MTTRQKVIAPILFICGGATGVLAIAALNPVMSAGLFMVGAAFVLGGLMAADSTTGRDL